MKFQINTNLTIADKHIEARSKKSDIFYQVFTGIKSKVLKYPFSEIVISILQPVLKVYLNITHQISIIVSISQIFILRTIREMDG